MGCHKLIYQDRERALEINPFFIERGLGKKGYAEKNRVRAYRYGFNGMEKDDEAKGAGNSYATHFRQYDPRIGKWLSLDPVVHAGMSPYNAFDNNPIYYIDPRGSNSGWFVNDSTGNVLHVPGVDNLKGIELEGVNNKDYTLFATDQEMKDAKEFNSNTEIPTNEYEYKSYDKSEIDQRFYDWGVSWSYQLVTIQTYEYEDLIAYDFEPFGRMETSSRIDFKVLNTRYLIHSGMYGPKAGTNEMYSFNKIHQPEFVGYSAGDFYRIDRFNGQYFSYTINGSPQQVPRGNGFGSNAGENLLLIGWEFLWDVFISK